MFNDILLASNTNKGVKLFPDYSKAFTVYAPYTLTQDSLVIARTNQTVEDRDNYLTIDGYQIGSMIGDVEPVSFLGQAGSTFTYSSASHYRMSMCIIPLQTH